MANRSGLDRYKHQLAGYRAVMRSPEVQAMLQHRVDAIRQAVEPGLADEKVYLLADTTVGRTRAGGTVIGVPLRIEKKRRLLGAALGAGR